jgi:hypothetical protein
MYLPVEHGTPSGRDHVGLHNQHDYLRTFPSARLLRWVRFLRRSFFGRRLLPLTPNLDSHSLPDRATGCTHHELEGLRLLGTDILLSLCGDLPAVEEHGVLIPRAHPPV